ncbi:MAG TPA: DUF2934 domain-containing protein [Tepidisphaeraceae bacterium]|jgi:hypothetical protein|nr:DUF2934 domain-containing protein [Tepidisphaeraceae bacterium]
MAKFEQTKNPRIGNEVRSEPTPQPTRTSTPIRNSAIPKISTPQSGRRDVSHDQIAKRAYEISISGSGGSELDNWLRAERELKGQ